jgi:DNA-binding IclR family transcriptional regulator
MGNRVDTESMIKGAIRSFWKANGYGPSFRDLAEDTGLAVGTVHEIVVDLGERGEISYHERVARSLRA